MLLGYQMVRETLLQNFEFLKSMFVWVQKRRQSNDSNEVKQTNEFIVWDKKVNLLWNQNKVSESRTVKTHHLLKLKISTTMQ